MKSRAMRITFVLGHAGLSGGVRVVATYAKRLQERGHRVVVISRPWDPKGRKEKAVQLVRRVFHKVGARHLSVDDPSYLDGVDVEHVRVAGSRATDSDVPDADVVIATWWETAEWVAGFSPRKGAKVYFLQGFDVQHGQPAHRVSATWSLPLQKIAVAKWLCDIARDEFDDPTVQLIPNSVDLEIFNAVARGKQPVPTVGLMYAPTSIKGCDISLKAFELARARRPDLRLKAFGLERPADALPLPRGAEYACAPSQQTIVEIYRSCDAWLFGSRREGFGLPILEAMACRTPVIATPAGAAPELLERGGGLLVPQEDPSAMADAIEKVCTLTDEQWRVLSDAALATATSYTWDDATDLFEAALLSAIDRSTRSRLSPCDTRPC